MARKYLKEVIIPLEDGGHLYGILSQPQKPKRVVLIPPLIGSTAELQPVRFKYLTTKGSEILSFEYRGHGRSSGLFSLTNSVEDTRTALKWAFQYAASRDLPLHTVSTCYGTITLLSNLNSHGNEINICSVNTVSGLFSMNYVIKPENLAEIVSQGTNIQATPESLASMISDATINLKDKIILRVFAQYLHRLFSELDIGEDHFGKLTYERTDRRRTVLEFLTERFLDGVVVPRAIPVNLFYGEDDKVIGLSDLDTKKRYISDAKRIAPHAKIHAVDIDHFGVGKDRQLALEELCKTFEAVDG